MVNFASRQAARETTAKRTWEGAEQIFVNLGQVLANLWTLVRHRQHHQGVVCMRRVEPFAHRPAHLPPAILPVETVNTTLDNAR
jgi:hypothetical protein